MSGQASAELRALFNDMRALIGIRDAAFTGRYGVILADDEHAPTCAAVSAGDVLMCGGSFGEAGLGLMNQALASADREWLVYVPKTWEKALHKDARFKCVKRYAFEHEVQPKDEDIARLLERADEATSFQPIEGAWVETCRKESWSRDFVSSYPTREAYTADGLGTLVLHGGIVVAGASSYVSYDGGIEVQVQTKDGFEGHGYATLAAAKLIRMGHARGLLVTWDAANQASEHMANKLGYQEIGTYSVYELRK